MNIAAPVSVIPAASDHAASLTNRLSWQEVLFVPRLDRLALLRLKANWQLDIFTLNVHRNHAFEPVARPLQSFLEFAGLETLPAIGDYDDALSFAGYRAADADLIWLDFTRYEGPGDNIAQWLSGRIQALGAAGARRIIIANWADGGGRGETFNAALGALAEKNPLLTVLDVAGIAADLGEGMWDARRTALAGTRLSDQGCLRSARALGALLATLLQQNIKAIAVDLDNSLYQGVLGEQGVDGVVLTDGHRAVQQKLVVLSEKGIFLVCVSRNEPEDVKALFAARADFPLQAKHFVDWRVSWGSKASAIRAAAEKLRIATNAFLFLDDNPGELMAVGHDAPDVQLMFAKTASQSVTALACYPRLWPLKTAATDLLRVADSRANEARERMTDTITDPRAYVAALDVALEVAAGREETVERLHDMSRKTNQFNIALRRFGVKDVMTYIGAPGRGVATVALKDKLSDSGIIAAVFVTRHGDEVVVDELCISCRAMGRHLEDLIVVSALEALAGGAKSIRFDYRRAPRNTPALEWLARFSGRPVEGEEGSVAMSWGPDKAEAILSQWPVAVCGI